MYGFFQLVSTFSRIKYLHLIKIRLLVSSFYAPPNPLSLSLSLSLNCITAKRKGIKHLSSRHFMLQFPRMSTHQNIESVFPFIASTTLLNLSHTTNVLHHHLLITLLLAAININGNMRKIYICRKHTIYT